MNRQRSGRLQRVWINLPVVVEAALAVVAASLAIRALPFARVLRLAGWRGRATAADFAAARRARWAVDRFADLVPWRALCFERGLALQWMLRRRGFASFFHYGVGRDGGAGVSAHVWVVLDGVILIGEPAAAAHACLAIRPEPARP